MYTEIYLFRFLNTPLGGVGATQTFAPGVKYPRAATAATMYLTNVQYGTPKLARVLTSGAADKHVFPHLDANENTSIPFAFAHLRFARFPFTSLTLLGAACLLH